MTAAAAPSPPASFEIGATYTTSSLIDHTFIHTYTVVHRTAKFITVQRRDGTTSRVGVKTNDAGEWARPDGSYSMAPLIEAGRSRVSSTSSEGTE